VQSHQKGVVRGRLKHVLFGLHPINILQHKALK
jgi:hypothetical protein